MVAWPIVAAQNAGAGKIAVIVSPGFDLSAGLPEGTETVVQEQSDGTGGAVRAALGLIKDAETVVVLSGDVPLVSSEIVANLIAAHREAGAGATVMTAILDDPGSYGRVVRDRSGAVDRIVEAKEPGDATRADLEIKEINTGTYVFDGPAVAEALVEIGNDNSQGEYYLGDVLPLIRDGGRRVVAHIATDPAVNLGINTRADLATVEAEARKRILRQHMLNGVTVADPASTWVDVDVQIAPDVTLLPGTSLCGETRVGAGSVVGPHTTLIETDLGEGATVPHSYLVDCEVLDGCSVGPFAYIRPQTVLKKGSKAGAFVELKNTIVGEGSKVPHLAYVGDTEIGSGSNLGAGTITANYDGFRKHRTVIGDHVRIGVDTMLIAPVEVGDSAYTGGGSVITQDVPEGALGISRAPQENISGFAQRRAASAKEEEGS